MQSAQNYIHEDEINFRDIFDTLWNGKWIIVCATSIFAIVSIIWVLQIPNEYRSFITLVSTQSERSSLANMASSELGGLASFAGVSFAPRETTQSQIVMEIMQSWGFIEAFIKENDLAVKLAAVDGWNRTTNQLIINDDIYDIEKAKWVSVQSQGKTTEPTSWKLFEIFSGKLNVSQDTTTSLITVSIDYYSPIIAKQWVELFVEATNTHMRSRKLNQANVNIQYLEEQIAKTSITGTKEVFYRIIEEQIKNKMLAEASPEFSFVTINKAMLPEEKFSPIRSQIVALVTLIGGVFSVLLVLILGNTSYKFKSKSNTE